MASRARSVCKARQRTQRVHRVLPVPVAHQQCTTGTGSTHGKRLDRVREPGGKNEQKGGGRRSYTYSLESMREVAQRTAHHVAPRTMRMGHLLGEPCTDSLPTSVRAITASRTISPASTACRAGSSLSEACDSSLRGSFEISSGMEPTPCQPCCSSM